MGRPEGMHMVLERIEGHISHKSQEKKAAPEKELSTTLSDKKKCFACNERLHNLDQCKIKGSFVTVAELFGHATRFPFYMIQPSEEVVAKEKFYHHCLLITSNISNLDLGRVKDELQKFWKLSNDWELRRECRKNFIASFSSEDDLISCLKHPEMETSLDDKEMKFTVTRWKEGGEENIDLIRQWFLVCGVPRIYRNWKELYQVASAFGVLVEVDEESLEVEDKEPIRLKIALRNLDGTPFSYHFVFGWSSRMVTFTIEDKVKSIEQQRKELEEWNGKDRLDGFNKESEDKRNIAIGMPPGSCHNTRIVASTGNHALDLEGCSNKVHKKELNTAQAGILLEEPKFIEELRFDREIKENKTNAPAVTTINSKKTTEKSSKAEVAHPIGGSSTNMIGEEHFRGIPKPPVIHVFKRRAKKQQGSIEQKVNEALNNSSSKKLDKGMDPDSTSYATRIGALTGCDMLDFQSCSEKEHGKELNMAEKAIAGERPKPVEEFGAYRENKDNNEAPDAATINSKKKQTTDDTSKTETTQLISGSSTFMIKRIHKKGVDMDGVGPEGVQFHERQYASKVDARLAQNSKEFSAHNDICDSFSEMGLPENLLKGIYAYGLEKASAIHQRGIVPLCKGLDVILQALSGTTVTLCCGVLQQLDYGSEECQALVLVPTRDLAQETEKVIRALGKFLGVKAHACSGGTSIREDQQILSSGVQVIVGTPGRVLDMLQRRALCPDHIRTFVLDEADELLTGGFKDQTCNVIQLLPPKIQVGLLSATFSNEALEFSRRFMDKPVTIIVPRDEELRSISVKQLYVKVEKEEVKLGKVCDLFDTMAITQSVIFVNTRRKVKSLIEKIKGKGYTVSASHGSMDQHARDTAIQEFQSGSSRILIATDLRGTDVVQVPVVINYDLPTQPVKYIRRVQQGGQSGRKGVVISFVTRVDERILLDIQRFCNGQVGELPSDIADLLVGYGVQN
ncbi:ATP-dependent RNA helicase drs1-like [Phragmites australis]|uniref:ATP-dependent RNA helicase drs1-like n=1 Tax=Phragmites australis TaxID=29695 RepID=UPI002D77383B|nr:ATP-dependent RNA helicase drs1-like [Phragmites australis]